MIMDQQTNKYINSTGTLPHTGDKASGLLTGGPAREKERGREKKREHILDWRNRKNIWSNQFHWDSWKRRGNGLASKQLKQTTERPASLVKHLLLQSLSAIGSMLSQMMSLHITILFKLWLVTSGSCRKHEPIRNSNHNKLCLKPYWLYYIDCSCGTFILCITTLYCHDCFCDQQGNISNKHTENKSCNIKHWLTKPMIPRPLYHLKN